MNRTASLLLLALTLGAAPDPLPVTASLSPKPYLVGRAIEVTLEIGAGAAPSTVETPRVQGAEVHPLPPDPGRPATRRFVVVPARAGPLDLPAFRSRSGDRSGASRPARVAVAGLPTEGRTGAFLGGVGPFEVRAEAGPTGVRAGETLEYRVQVTGQAAWGSSMKPDLGGRMGPSVAVEPLADEFRPGESPTRTFRYRIRPLKAGRVTLPPVAVSAFDPATRRYATRATSGVTVRVEDPPRLDPARLEYGPGSAGATRSRPGPAGLAAGAAAVASGSTLAAWLVARRRRKPRPAGPRELARQLAMGFGLEPGMGEVEAARAVAGALTNFLKSVGGRPPGALTPPEARAGFERLTTDPAIPARAEALVARCDRARYGARGAESEGGDLAAEARRFFEGLAASERWRGGGPGEAVETTPEA